MIRVRPPLVQLPFDLLRAGFEETVRGALPPEEPEILRFLGGVGWRFGQRLTPARARLVAEEARRTFRVTARTAGAVVREAQDLGLQARMEELVVPRMGAELDQIVRVDGSFAAPALVLYPHAGSVRLLQAALARRWPGLVVFGARGLPPEGPAAVGPDRGTRINRFLQARRRDDEARMAIRWEEDPGALAGWLAKGHVVAAAYDDRAWPDWVRVPFLGREALLSEAPFRIAREAGVPLIPASIHRERDKSSLVRVGAPFPPDLRRYLAERAEPFLREHPGHYAGWLAECRMRAGLDDHPLFVDYAPDDRWRRWPEG